MGQYRRRCPNIKPTLGQRLVFATQQTTGVEPMLNYSWANLENGGQH